MRFSLYTEDASLIGSSVTIQIDSTLEEELGWYNTTEYTINYLQPDCRVSQADILANAQYDKLELEATINDERTYVSIEYIYESARETFLVEDETAFCGDIDFELINEEEPDVDISFFSLDKERLDIKLEALPIHEAGFYDRLYLRFFFVEHPTRQMIVRFIVEIKPCLFSSVQFKR